MVGMWLSDGNGLGRGVHRAFETAEVRARGFKVELHDAGWTVAVFGNVQFGQVFSSGDNSSGR